MTTSPRPGRNDPCHCGSGKKYKKCHADQDEAAESARLKKAGPPPMQGDPMRMMARLREMAGPNLPLEDLQGDLAALAAEMTSGEDPAALGKMQGAMLKMLEEDGPLGALRFEREKLFTVVTRNLGGVSLARMDEQIRGLIDQCVPELATDIPAQQWQDTLRGVMQKGDLSTTQRRALMMPLLEGLMGGGDDEAARSKTVLPMLVFIRQCQDEIERAQLRLQSLRDNDPDAPMETIQEKVRAEQNPFLTLVVQSAISEVLDESKAPEELAAND